MGDLFANRSAAGRALADRLQAYAGRGDVVVSAVARGGAPVAWEVAQSLRAPLDLICVRRLRVVQRPELAFGAIAKGAVHIDAQAVQRHALSERQIDESIATETVELIRRDALCQGLWPRMPLQGRTVIVVDDGVVTGASMHAALQSLRLASPAWVVVAVGAAPPAAQDRIGTAADDYVCASSPADFTSVGRCYADASPISEEQVRALMVRAASRQL